MQKKQLENYAKLILKHEEEYEEVKRRIATKMLNRFRLGDDKTKRVVADIMNADEIFMSELKAIIAENIET